MLNVVFVCAANICRSPVAEVLFADWLKRQSLPGEWRVSSAGIGAVVGSPATAYAQEIVEEQGLTLSRHRGRLVEASLLDAADVILCMTRAQQQTLQARFPESASRIYLLSSMAGASHDIQDPYGGPRQGYVELAKELRRLIEAGGPKIVEWASRT